MREIKFRAWDKEDKKMFYMQDYKPQTFFEDLFSRENGVKNLFPEHTMQFTGLKDKNGKEIYEGDILDTIPKTIRVCWDSIKGKWFGQYTDKKRTSSFWMGKDFKKHEVIGNLYENPELIGGEK